MIDKKLSQQFSSIENILEYAMAEEQDASKFYRDAARRMTDPKLQKFLLDLAELEIEHYNTLKNKLDECRADSFSSNGIRTSFHEEV